MGFSIVAHYLQTSVMKQSKQQRKLYRTKVNQSFIDRLRKSRSKDYCFYLHFYIILINFLIYKDLSRKSGSDNSIYWYRMNTTKFLADYYAPDNIMIIIRIEIIMILFLDNDLVIRQIVYGNSFVSLWIIKYYFKIKLPSFIIYNHKRYCCKL